MPDADFNIELFYRFTRLDKKNSILVKRDAAEATLVSVGARWTVVSRPRRVGFTTYDGSDPYRMDVPILFDGWDDGRGQEDAISILNQMRISADYVQPTTVSVDGALPVKGATWVIENIDFGNNVIWHPNNYRLRQDAVVHLLQFIEADELAIKPASTAHIYTVKTGDTLKSISKSQYGTTKFWSSIKKANNIRDVKKLPKTLRIPAIIGH